MCFLSTGSSWKCWYTFNDGGRNGKGPEHHRQTKGDSHPEGSVSYGEAQYWLINDGYRVRRHGVDVKLINNLYLLNETTLILVPRSGWKRANLLPAFNFVGISLITKGTRGRFSLHRKPIVHLRHLSTLQHRSRAPGLVGNSRFRDVHAQICCQSKCEWGISTSEKLPHSEPMTVIQRICFSSSVTLLWSVFIMAPEKPSVEAFCLLQFSSWTLSSIGSLKWAYQQVK